MALGKLGVLVNFINQQYKVCKIAHFGLFKVNLEFRISGVTWKMKYQFVLETGNLKNPDSRLLRKKAIII